jgi:hypothetical protein
VEGFVGEPNQFGAFLVFFLPIAASIIVQYRPRPPTFWWLTLFLTLFLLIVAGSRGAYVAAVGGTFIAAWYLKRFVNIKALIKVGGSSLLLITIMTVTAVWVIEVDFIRDRVLSIFGVFDSTTPKDATAGRFGIWLASMRTMLEWPLSFVVGYGWNSYGDSGIWKAAHSEYVNTLYELGAVGLMMFITLFAVILSRTRRAIRKMPAEMRRLQISFVFALTAVLVDVLFVEITAVWPLVWIYVGLFIKLQARHAELPDGWAEESGNVFGAEPGTTEPPLGGLVWSKAPPQRR